MPINTLKANLEKLRGQLAEPQDLDDETRQELSEIVDTIEKVLGEPTPNYSEARANIENAALNFEARHPRFSRVLSEVTDALAKLGI